MWYNISVVTSSSIKKMRDSASERNNMENFYLFESEKGMILGGILMILGLALMVPALSTIGLFWVQKTILMRNMIMAIAGIGVGSYGVYTFVTKGIFG